MSTHNIDFHEEIAKLSLDIIKYSSDEWSTVLCVFRCDIEKTDKASCTTVRRECEITGRDHQPTYSRVIIRRITKKPVFVVSYQVNADG